MPISFSSQCEEPYDPFSNFSYWGCGADGSGCTMFGRVLMEARDLLCYAEQSVLPTTSTGEGAG